MPLSKEEKALLKLLDIAQNLEAYAKEIDCDERLSIAQHLRFQTYEALKTTPHGLACACVNLVSSGVFSLGNNQESPLQKLKYLHAKFGAPNLISPDMIDLHSMELFYWALTTDDTWNYVVTVCQTEIEAGRNLPEPLNLLASYSMKNSKRPNRRGRTKLKELKRNHLINVLAIELENRFVLKQYQIHEIIREAFEYGGMSMLTEDAIRKIIDAKQK